MFSQPKLYLIFFFSLIVTGCNDLTSSINESRRLQAKFVNGKKVGTFKKYHSNGNLSEIANYKNDTLNGTCVTYDENGKIYTKARYKMGIFVDSFILYFQNGQVRSESWLDSNGKEQGLFKIYYENGAVRQIGHAIDDYFDDTIKTYYANRQLMYIEYYKNRKRQGVFTYYDEQGKPIKNEYYKNDSLLNEIHLQSSFSSGI